MMVRNAVAVVSAPSVPPEIVRAVGLRPAFVLGSSAPTPAADAIIESEVFPSRLRHLMDAALAGRLADAACIVLPPDQVLQVNGLLSMLAATAMDMVFAPIGASSAR